MCVQLCTHTAVVLRTRGIHVHTRTAVVLEYIVHTAKFSTRLRVTVPMGTAMRGATVNFI